MTSRLRLLVSVLVAWALASPAWSGVCDDAPSLVTAAVIGDSRVGGTGLGGDDSGIGGTGYGGGGDDSGVGGTGIYGTITGFGSICVNGKRVHIDREPGAVFARNGRTASADDLAVGRVVWIDARERDDGEGFDAHRVHVLSALIGRVEAVAPRRRWLRVDGVWIDVPREALVDGATGPLKIRRGDTVDVYGLPSHGGRISASRVDRVAPWTPRWRAPELGVLLRQSPAVTRLSIEGLVSSVGGGRFAVPGLEVATKRAVDLERGQRVWLDGARVAPNRMQLDRARVLQRPSAGGLPPLLPPVLRPRHFEKGADVEPGPAVQLEEDILPPPKLGGDDTDLQPITPELPDLLRERELRPDADVMTPQTTPSLPGLDISRPDPVAPR